MPSTSAADLLAEIRVHGAVPRHVAIIMDGNGRWARERRMPRPYGHRSGMGSVREVVEGAVEAGLEVLSLFAFSQENWQRPPTEITALMSLLEEYIAREGRADRGWVELIEAYPQRFMIGSDKVGRFAGYSAEILKYEVLLDALKPETADRVGRSNFLSVLPARGATLKMPANPAVELLPAGR